MNANRSLLALLMLFAANVADAQYINVNATRRNCTPLGCTVQDCRGSGVCVGTDDAGRSIVLTAGHCMSSGAQWYHVGQAEWIAATSLGYIEGHGQWKPDVGMLATQKSVQGCVPLGDAPPAPGKTVKLHSYLGGDGKAYRVREAQVLSADEESLVVSIPSAQGDSGGAVVYEGRVVGIISATGSTTTTCTSAAAIRKFVIQKLGKLPNCGKPNHAPAQTNEAPPPPEAPAAEPKPDPISTPQCDCEPKLNAILERLKVLENSPHGNGPDVSFLTIEINKLRAELAAIQQKKLPDIPVELYNADTGELIGRRVVPLGQPIKLSTKDRRVK